MSKSGWYNDRQRHKLASKGIRTGNIKVHGKEIEEEHPFVDDLDFWDLDEIKEFEKEFGEIQGVEEVYGMYEIETDMGKFIVFNDYDKAERMAKDRLVDMFSQEGIMPVDWVVESNIFITDTDRRIIANEEADNVVMDMNDDEIFDMSQNRGYDYKEQYENNEGRIGDIEDEIDELEDKRDATESDISFKRYETRIDKLNEEKDKMEEENNVIIEKARDSLMEDIYEEWYKGLEDPINFLVNEQGLYTEKQLLKQNFISIDYEGMAQEVIDSDGVASVLATYDGNEYEIGNAWVYRID